MDSNHIEQLLERYWQCETSVEEEAQLRAFFAEADHVPAHLMRYRDWFVSQQHLAEEECLGADFDARLLAKIGEAPVVVKARRLTLTARLMPLFKAAAMVAVVLMLGNVAQHSFTADVQEVAATDTIGRQISAPSVALSDEAAAATYEQQLLDSLRCVSEEPDSLVE